MYQIPTRPQSMHKIMFNALSLYKSVFFRMMFWSGLWILSILLVSHLNAQLNRTGVYIVVTLWAVATVTIIFPAICLDLYHAMHATVQTISTTLQQTVGLFTSFVKINVVFIILGVSLFMLNKSGFNTQHHGHGNTLLYISVVLGFYLFFSLIMWMAMCVAQPDRAKSSLKETIIMVFLGAIKLFGLVFAFSILTPILMFIYGIVVGSGVSSLFNLSEAQLDIWRMVFFTLFFVLIVPWYFSTLTLFVHDVSLRSNSN